ncbi:hypothetical protein SBA4_2690016 [Candidatus Sulfopaludibacter sp. SbA4]|nr:hypothetical protein SBA4_2690016 [Candidatus Sulfopaludibacter sp. SbA4]
MVRRKHRLWHEADVEDRQRGVAAATPLKRVEIDPKCRPWLRRSRFELTALFRLVTWLHFRVVEVPQPEAPRKRGSRA